MSQFTDDDADASSPGSNPIVEVRDVSVSFAGIRALTEISVACTAGRVYGIVGPNGAGKSTLVRVIAGLVEPSSGSLWIDGRQQPFGDQHHAARLGIRLVPQETALIDAMTVEANINLGNEIRRAGLLRRRDLTQRARVTTEMLGLDVGMSRLAGSLPLAEKRLVMVAKALSSEPRLLILDEPTAAMSEEEAARVLAAVARLRSRGVTTLLITHRLDEVVSVCDEVIGIRDGQLARTWHDQAPTVTELVTFVTGEVILAAPDPAVESRVKAGPALLSARNLKGSELQSTNIDLTAGEVVGVVGRPGSGAEQLLAVLAGVEPSHEMAVSVKGRLTSPHSPAEALRAGIGYLSSDRTRAELPAATVAQNITLSGLRSVAYAGAIIRRRQERELARRNVPEGLASRLADPLATLSCGNRQRVLVSRLVAAWVEVFLLSNPTVGVDVDGRRRFRDDVRVLAARGKAVLIYTSEPEDLLGLAHRVLAFDNGQIHAVLAGNELTEANLLAATMMARDIVALAVWVGLVSQQRDVGWLVAENGADPHAHLQPIGSDIHQLCA